MHARRCTGAIAVALVGIAAAGCGVGASDDEAEEPEAGHGVVYGLGDDHGLWRWEVGDDEAEQVVDLSDSWQMDGDVGQVMRSSLTIAPDQRHLAWIAGGSQEAELRIAELGGEVTETVPYPLDHACLDPSWLADGSSLLVHRADVWDEDGTDAMPAPVEDWGATEWHAPDSEPPSTAFDLEQGCRLRWYSADDGTDEGLYRSLDAGELRRVDASGAVVETILVDDLDGADPQMVDLVAVDPTGRYACLATGYDEFGEIEVGFTVRPQFGTGVVDLSNGALVGPDGSDCESMGAEGYLTRADNQIGFVDYDGRTRWEDELPVEIDNAPSLYYFEES